MKKRLTLILILSVFTSVFGQKLDYDHDSKWFFGLNAGAAWNTTDVKNKTHIGYGFVLGRSFNYNYGKKFSFDLRLRYLGGKWYGQDYDTTAVTGNPGYDPMGKVAQLYDTTLGYTYNNFQTQVHEIGLELVLHANSLREKTGWDPYIFGGANFVWNQTYGDLYNQDSTMFMSNHYAYSPNGMSKSEWKELSDEIYDSALDGSHQSSYNVNFMPSIGIGLAYQVGPRFSVGIEHKTTFTLKNDFDGYKGNTMKWGMFKNDIYHYTALMLKFNFRSRKVDDEIETVKNDCLDPAIGIVSPVSKTLTVSSTQFNLEALISQVSGKNNIQLMLNGVSDTNFIYSTGTSKLNSSLTLIMGQNTIDITASNGCGKATERINVLYEECVPPTVLFVNPVGTEITTNEQTFTVTAQLERAKSIKYSINDKALINYNYNETENTFSSTITLAEGKNSIKLLVSNECGTQEKIIDVIYVRCDKPSVKINDGDRIIKVDNRNYTVSALFENVTNKSQITLKLNNTVKTFAFNTSSKELIQKLILNEGTNNIEITAKNVCGETTENITIDYAPCITPKITMVSPSSSTSETEQSAFSIRAIIDNITLASQVSVTLNGRSVGTGLYSTSNRTFEKDINLVRGKNTVTLTVTTECGTVSSAFTINSTLVEKDIIICFKGQTLIIKESQWNAYAAQGATQGECPQPVDNNITICFKGQTLIIKESQWNAYAAQGAIQGECPKPVDNDITICFKGQTLIIKESQWNAYAAQGAIQGECPKPVDNNITICFKGQTLIIKESQWNTYAAQGAIQGECPKPVDNDITICFKGQTLIIKESQWNAYAAQGAIQGECPKPVDNDITICFKGHTMIIKESQWSAYVAQGATQGECPQPIDNDMTICFNGNTITIKESEWKSYSAKGATQGECPKPVDKDITICLRGQQLTIKESQWSKYETQGATLGKCPEPDLDLNITICYNDNTLVIKESQLADYLKLGAVQGKCVEVTQEKTITICHSNQDDPNVHTTITILESEWPSHEAHGDALGECVEVIIGADQMQICLNGETIIIDKSEWPSYRIQGAKTGACK